MSLSSSARRGGSSLLRSQAKSSSPRSGSRRAHARIARLESLESRLCPSVYYDFDLLAQSGASGINAIQPGASINDDGIVAFVGDVAGGQSVFAQDGTSLIDVAAGFINTTLTYGPELQINNAGLIAVGDRLTGGTTSTRANLFDINSPGTRTIIGRGTSPLLDPNDFDAIGRFASLSNDGNVAFAGLNGTSWEIHLSNARVDRGDLFTQVATYTSGTFFRFQAADGDRIVIASRQGTTKRIQLYDITGIDTSATIASTASGNWSELGIRPGVSDDGSIVVFFGVPTTAGAAALGVAEGPGIFASIEDGGLTTRRVIRLTRGTGANPGMPELGWDDMGNPITFNFTNIDEKIGISHASLGTAGLDDDTFTVSFLATPSQASRTNPVPGAGGVPLFFSDQLGLWTIRVDIDRQLSAPNNRVFHPTTARPVVQIGDVLRFGMGASSTITTLAVGDAIANAASINGAARTQRRDDHLVAFQAGTAGGGTIIVRGQHLDSDEDGLLDHWESQTGGIDMDQDGTIDLNLYNLGARFDSRDLFLEIDWLTNRTFGVPSPSGGWDPEPAPGVAQAVVDMFAAAPALPNGIPAGIRVHFDAGDGLDALGNPRSINMGTDPTRMQGGDHIAQPGTVNHIDMVYYGLDGSNAVSGIETRSLTELKDKNFGTTDKRARELAFHYIVMADFYDLEYDSLLNAYFTPSPAAISAVGANTLDPVSAVSATDGSGNPNPLAGHVVIITSGPGDGTVRTIASNTANRITLSTPWPAGNLPDNTSQFLILSGSSGRAEVDFYRSPDFHSIPGNDTIISLGGFGTSQVGLPGAQIDIMGNLFYQWRTIVHELGHTLGLRHGGTDHNAYKGANYLSLMSYSHQTTIGSAVNSYSDGTDPNGYSDWDNLRLDFQNYLVHLGNSFGQALGSTLPPEDLPAMDVQDVIQVNDAPLDLDGPTLNILAPAPGANVPLDADLIVNFTASDPSGLGPLQAAIDLNADGDTTDPGEVLTPTATGNPAEFSATIPTVPGPAGARELFVTTQDALGNFTSRSVSLTFGLPESNVPPVLDAISDQTVNEAELLSFTAVATDANLGQILTYSITSGPANASINPATGLFSFTPAEDQGPGSFSVTIRATDNADPPLFDEKTFTITVNEVNLPPVLDTIPDQSLDELTTLALTVSASDADLPANLLTYSLVGTVPDGLTLDPATGVLAWTPTEAQGPGSYSITVRATDNSSPTRFDEQTFVIQVAEVNAPPIIESITDQFVDEFILLSIPVIAIDPDVPASVLLYELIAAPQGSAIDPVSGLFSFEPTEAQGPGVYPVTVRVYDAGSPPLFAEVSFQITVNEVNLPPVLDNIPDQSLDELTPLALTLSATDPDVPANTLNYSFVGTPPEGMLLDPTTGALSWTPTEAQGPGSYSITVHVSDSGSPVLFDEQTFEITVREVNQAPSFTPVSNKVVSLEQLLSFTASAADPDLPINILSYEILSGPEGATIDSTGLFQWTPAASVTPGEYPVTLRVTDNGSPANLSDEESFTITVTINQPPVLDPIADQTIPENALFSFTAVATDPESDPLTFSLTGAVPPGAVIDPATGTFSWTPTEAQGPGVYAFTLRVAQMDNPVLADEQLLTLTITEANAAPILDLIPDQTIEEGANLALTFTATDSDLPANTLTFNFVGSAPSGTLLNTQTGAFSWTPTEAQGPGAYTITIRVSDDGTPTLSNEQSFTITVLERNEPPIIDAGGPYTVEEGGSVLLTALVTDPDLPANTLIVSWDLDGNGTFETPGASVSFSAAAIDGPSTRAVTARVDDGQGEVRTAQATVNIQNVAPQAVSAGADQSSPEGQPVSFTAAFTDPGIPGGETHTITWRITPPVGDPFTRTGAPLEFTPTDDGVYAIELTVQDSSGASASDTATLTVTPAGPVISGLLPGSLTAGDTLAQQITITDPGLDPITSVEVDYGTGEGFQPASIDSMGRVNLSHVYANSGAFTLVVRATDADEITTCVETTITVTPVNVDETGPLVGVPVRHGAFYQTTRFVLPFDEPLDPEAATDPTLYTLVAPGPDGRFNSQDDRPLAIRAVRHHEEANSVIIEPARRLRVHARYQLILNGEPGGISDLAGNLLDGDRDGTPGGNARLLITGRNYSPTPFIWRALSAPQPGALTLALPQESNAEPAPLAPPTRSPAFRISARHRLKG